MALVWWLSQKFAHANAAALAKALKVVGGVLALGAAGVMALRGRIDMAFLLGGLGAWLLGWSVYQLPWMQGSRPRTPGGVSRVRSAMIEMELHHDTGAMSGSVLAGSLAGAVSTISTKRLCAALRGVPCRRPGRGPAPRGVSRPPVSPMA